MDITYETSAGMPGGFVANVEGYLCFIEPKILDGVIAWYWVIQSGGGWSCLGSEKVKQHFEGVAPSSLTAQAGMIESLEKLLD
ncbi:MAG: hypothetical protein PHY54_18575 [Methylococcales bacterium]|nr:hypothetical protein [Methylococcales bacterium]